LVSPCHTDSERWGTRTKRGIDGSMVLVMDVGLDSEGGLGEGGQKTATWDMERQGTGEMGSPRGLAPQKWMLVR
jgi:hypothetical protein